MYFLVVFTFFFCVKIDAKCLNDLSVTGYTLVPNFNSNTHKYNVFIKGNSINIKGKSKYDINGLGSYMIDENKKDIIITCKNEEYKISVFKDGYKEESKAKLKNLIIEGFDISFDPDTFYYEIDSDTTPNIKYETYSYKDNVSLSEEDNIITIDVSTFDDINTYTIKINKTISVYAPKKAEKKKLTNVENTIVISFIVILDLLVLFLIYKKLFGIVKRKQ